MHYTFHNAPKKCVCNQLFGVHPYLLWASGHVHVLHTELLHWAGRGHPGGSEGVVGHLGGHQVCGGLGGVPLSLWENRRT
jgi:hypothetical protein